MGQLLLVTGGARSGKSRYGVERANAWGPRVLYLATCQPADDEMRERVRRHQAERPASWITVEPGVEVAAAVEAHGPHVDGILLDCLTLYVSGLLAERLGGRSVKPYQPDGLLKDMVFSNMTEYAQEKGEDLWRRSLYTFWKRTVMPPAMQVFDAATREYCQVSEARTNTPLQALNLMNDVTYVESARMLGQRMMLEGGAKPGDRLTWGFRLASGRAPDELESRVLLGSLETQLAHFQRNPDAATELLAVGEKRHDPGLEAEQLAAYAVVGGLILNLDEVITKQ